ncbi:hypothetical protein N4R57_11685 [Rhodobacteraceae bacterium D3-12]|nr:hypothetical protein N4R57_11685 [Rhodobacteraceae bacterium D3-12]
MPQTIAPEKLDLAALIRPGETIAWGQAASEPLTLTETLMAQRHALGGVKAFIGVSWHDTVDPAHTDRIDFTSYCGTGRNRLLHKAGKLDIMPVHYSRFEATLPPMVDILFLQLAPGRKAGHYSFGLSCEYLWPLIRNARLVVAEVNDRVPATSALAEIGESDIDIIVPTSRELPTPPLVTVTDVHRDIAAAIAGLVPDGATLQVGLGAIPAAILDALDGHRNLGVHTGLFVDGFTPLIESGVIDNSRKGIDQGYSVAGLISGGDETLRLCQMTNLIRLAPAGYTHNLNRLAALNTFTSVNSAIEVDLTGQINAEKAGPAYVGAIGGGPDFARGAALSKGGLPICALPAARKLRDGSLHSSIVTTLSGPTSISRADAGIIVTEYGVADLRHKSLEQRRQAMLNITHPDLREELERAS